MIGSSLRLSRRRKLSSSGSSLTHTSMNLMNYFKYLVILFSVDVVWRYYWELVTLLFTQGNFVTCRW